MPDQPKLRFGFSGGALKIIAILSMVIDHTAYLLVDYSRYPTLYVIMRSYIGRIAFPIFCFLLVEGFFHTRNIKKYALRLGLFAIIAEVPFDLAFSNRLVDPGAQNVFFTLLFGLGAIYALQFFNKKKWYVILALPAACAGAMLLHTDYGDMGVLLIVMFYVFHGKRLETGAVNGIFNYLMGQIWGMLSIPLIALYNGKKGLKLKYIFYIFYPLHLLILYGIYHIRSLSYKTVTFYFIIREFFLYAG